MKQSGFPTVESSGGQFAAADPIDVDYVPLFFHGYPSSLISGLSKFLGGSHRPADTSLSRRCLASTRSSIAPPVSDQ